MKISLNWLKDYVTTGLSTEALAHRLTMAGLEVEKITTVGGDTVFEFEITPNRPDCLCMLGIARETAAILNKSRKFPKIKKRTFPKKKCSISVNDKKGCTRYIGTLIENVTVKRAQDKIIKRLGAPGMKPINNIVDITNFCLMETGQPLHAFDYDKLVGGHIIVRKAKKGEKITTLDGVERELDPSILVIADQKRPVAIAGVMGGQNTEVTASTKNILLESACFDQVDIRRAARKLGLSSDSSYRFERGVDYAGVESGADRAIDLILDSAGGKITQRADVKVPSRNKSARTITVGIDKLNGYIGASLTTARCKNILSKLDCKITGAAGGKMKITPPSFRGDLQGFVDIVEEISRVIGYDNLPMSFPQGQTTAVLADHKRDVRRCVSGMLIAQGLNEIITYTMISRRDLQKSKQDELSAIEILNPLTQEQEIMRPSILPCHLSVLRSNINRGQRDIRYFEMGKIYGGKGEVDTVGIIMTGQRADDWRNARKTMVDYYDIKGVIEGIFARTGSKGRNLEFKAGNKPYFSKGESAEILVKGKLYGTAGRIDPAVIEQWGIKQDPVYFAELNMDCLYGQDAGTVRYKQVSELPSISRDISLAVPVDISAADIRRSIKDTATEHKTVKLTGIKFMELYEGDKIAKDRRGLIFSLTYESRLKKTLRDEEVEEIHGKVCDALVSNLGVIRR